MRFSSLFVVCRFSFSLPFRANRPTATTAARRSTASKPLMEVPLELEGLLDESKEWEVEVSYHHHRFPPTYKSRVLCYFTVATVGSNTDKIGRQ